MRNYSQLGLTVALLILCATNVVWAVPDTTPGALKSYSTIYSIGMEWQIAGDDDHDATCLVFFRKQGAISWNEGLPFYRVDYLPPQPQNGITQQFNGFAGSVFFLEPETNYEIRLELVDPDGGVDSRFETVSTRAIPQKLAAGRTFHVIPGLGGGSGSQANPFQGIAVAQNFAQAGDTFLIHAGHYQGFDNNGEIQLDKGGSQNRYVVWQAAGDGEVVFDPVRIAANYIWLEGVHIAGNPGVDDEFGLRTYNAPANIVITKNRFTDFYYSIALNHGGESWLITDNIIVGDKDVLGVSEGPPSWGGEGIELEHTSGHTVAYNSISRVADGISYPHHNTDIFRNEIFDVTDDGIETDYAYANIRVWENRISNARHNGFSFQPMNAGPWYFIRNQVAAPLESNLKIRQTSRVLLAHNTFVGWNNALGDASPAGVPGILTFESKNNIWISVDNQYAWTQQLDGQTPDWRTSLDYDGFDWGNSIYGFKWGANARYTDLPAFQAATGLELHGIRVNKAACFKSFLLPQSPPTSMPFQYMALKNNCNAVNAGIPLANINTGFVGSAPDLGAFELGAALPSYGPRKSPVVPDLPLPHEFDIAPILPLLLFD